MIRYIAVPGTHGAKREKDWDHPQSNFNAFLKEQDVEPLVVSPLKRYAWSTALDGVVGSNDTWDAAGRALAHYIIPPLADKSLVKPEDTFIIAHSHGGQVVAYACGKYGLKIEALITVGTPIRKDMYEIYALAEPNIKRHLHLYSPLDWMQILGALRDRQFGIFRKHPNATKNEKMPEGHGDVLRKPELFDHWISKGWLDFFKGANL